MVGFWIRAGKAITGVKPGARFKGQKTKESIVKKGKEFKSKIEKDKPVVKHFYPPKDF